MAKPTITTRASKGSALTWTEGDTNLTNLRDATITVKADTGGTDVVSDLNGTVTLVAGTNVTITGDNTAKTVTINSTASGGASALDDLSDVTITAAASGDLLYYNGTAWVDQAASGLTVGTASVGSTVTLTADNSTNATNYPLFVNDNTGNLSPRTDTGFTYNPSTGALTATTFSGTATNATNIGIASTTGNSNDTSMYLVMVGNSIAGNQAPHIDSSLTYNASTDTLSATVLSGSITATGATSTAKLTLNTTAVSSTAWTTNGIGLKVQAATFTDTSSTAGTVAASHVHAIATPTIASTNAITVTDAASLYIADGPTAGTNTTISNKWALLTAGNIKSAGATIGGTTFPTSTGTTGQVLSLSSAGTAAWTTASGGAGTNEIVLIPSLSNTAALAFPGNTANGEQVSNWTLVYNGGISGVSVSTTRFTLPTGTYYLTIGDFLVASSSTYRTNFYLYNVTTSTTLDTWAQYDMTMGGVTTYVYNRGAVTFTTTSSNTFTFRCVSAMGAGAAQGPKPRDGGYITVRIYKTA